MPVAVVARVGAHPCSTPATVPTTFVNRPPYVEPHRNSRHTVQTHHRSYAVRRRRDRATHQLDHPRPTLIPVCAVFACPLPYLASPRPNPSIHHKVEENPNIFITPKSCFELIHEFGNYSLWFGICVNDWFWVFVRWISKRFLDVILIYDLFIIWDWKEEWQNLVDHVSVMKTLDK